MSIQIRWETSIRNSPQTLHYVPLLNAELVVTTVDEVIIDCSWQIASQSQQHKSSLLAEQIQNYLMNPDDNHLAVSIYQQGTEYSQKVWNMLLNIPCGQVISYLQLAQKISSGPRAVAQACRNNPYAGIIPCHRVVAKAGIGGFVGQSQGPMVQLKRQLLDYEYSVALNRP
jgi:methylated-DNA-[protein]-cysteine S-methyltransferase